MFILKTDILPKDAKKENKSVYRVIKFGTIDRNGFIGTYEEIQRGLIPPKKRMNLDDPGLYSTSCNMKYSEAEYALNMFMRHYPKPFIAKGETEGSCGPCQLTEYSCAVKPHVRSDGNRQSGTRKPLSASLLA